MNFPFSINFFGGILLIRAIKSLHTYPGGRSLVLVDASIEGKTDITIPMIHSGRDHVFFAPRDWETIPQKFTINDVENIMWVDLYMGQDAVMMNGLPYLSPFFDSGSAIPAVEINEQQTPLKGRGG